MVISVRPEDIKCLDERKDLELLIAKLGLFLCPVSGGTIIDSIGSAKQAVENLITKRLNTGQIIREWTNIYYALNKGTKPEDFGSATDELTRLWNRELIVAP